MSLLDEMMESFAMMDRATVPDGLGGFNYQWTQGATFSAAIMKKNVSGTRFADKQDANDEYTITVYRGTTIEFHDVFKRLRDGATFRAISYTRESETPDRATFQIATFTAEPWALVGTEVSA